MMMFMNRLWACCEIFKYSSGLKRKTKQNPKTKNKTKQTPRQMGMICPKDKNHEPALGCKSLKPF
jgi:hypothetical protein